MADKLFVQAGKSVTSKRGLLSEGAEVFEKDFGGGAESVKGLIAKKIIGSKNPVKVEKAEVKKEASKEEKK